MTSYRDVLNHFNSIKSKESVLLAANLNLINFLTICGINLKFYDIS